MRNHAGGVPVPAASGMRLTADQGSANHAAAIAAAVAGLSANFTPGSSASLSASPAQHATPLPTSMAPFQVPVPAAPPPFPSGFGGMLPTTATERALTWSGAAPARRNTARGGATMDFRWHCVDFELAASAQRTASNLLTPSPLITTVRMACAPFSPRAYPLAPCQSTAR